MDASLLSAITEMQSESVSTDIIDIFNLECRQRERKNELILKRVQVEQLRKDLDAANLKIHEQNNSLSKVEALLEENAYTLNLAFKSSRALEERFQDKKDSITKSRLQQESVTVEKEALKELLQKSEIEKCELNRQLEEMKAQHNCDVFYQKELMKEEEKIKSMVAQVTKGLQSLEIDQEKLNKISNEIDLSKNLQNTVNFYKKQYNEIKNAKIDVEKQLIIANGVIKTFEDMLTQNATFFPINAEKSVVVKQYENNVKSLNEKTKEQDCIIEVLTNKMATAKEELAIACVKQNMLEKENTELKHDLKLIKEKKDAIVQTDCNNLGVCDMENSAYKKIKVEVIEICD